MDILSFRFNKNNQIFILQYLKTNQSCIDLFDIVLCENKDNNINFYISGIVFDDLDYEYDFNANLTFDLSKADFAYMEEKGYRLEKEDGENLTFRLKNPINRLSRMYEDRITFTRTVSGFQLEGLRKDVVRIVYGLEYKFRHNEEDEN